MLLLTSSPTGPKEAPVVSELVSRGCLNLLTQFVLRSSLVSFLRWEWLVYELRSKASVLVAFLSVVMGTFYQRTIDFHEDKVSALIYPNSFIGTSLPFAEDRNVRKGSKTKP